MDATVGEVAKITGLTVRTMHHYDEIGLVVPSGRTSSGYRLYSATDLERLHRVSTYRDLGFTLEEIAQLLQDSEDTNVADHLRKQHALVVERIAHLNEVKATIETMIEAESMNIRLTTEEKFEVFGEPDPSQYEAEAEQRWGKSDAYQEYARRTREYTKDEWLEIKAEAAELEETLAQLMRGGTAAADREAVAGAEGLRQHIDRWFYPCSHEMHCALADMYVGDDRFTAHYDDREPGLAQYVHDAIYANAATIY